MDFLEKDLEEIIYKTPVKILQERGLDIEGSVKRQLRIGNYGVSDLIYAKKKHFLHEIFNEQRIIPYLHINILELKKDKIGISAFFQAVNYARGIQIYMTENHPGFRYEIKITLVGKNVDTSGSMIYLPNLIYYPELSYPIGQLTSVEFYTYKYEVDGINFIPHDNYSLTGSGF